MSVILDRGAQKFWNLSHDPFSELPLQFEDSVDYDFLVKTENINVMSSIYSSMENDNVSKIYTVFGVRGCGKSTAQQYLYRLIEQEQERKGHFPIFCGVNLDEKSLDSIRLSVHYSILNSLIEKISGNREIAENFDIERSQRINRSGKFLHIETEIRRLIKMIHQVYYRVSIFIDDLDKADFKKYWLYKEYFRIMQSFYTDLCSYPTFIFVAVRPYFGTNFEVSDELSYLGMKRIQMKQWSKEELASLVSKRLRSAYMGAGRFNLYKVFDSEALDIIFEKNGMLPRYVINGCRRLMQRAYEASEVDEPGVTIPCKPIRKVFCNYFSEFVVGHGIPEFVSFKDLHGIVLQRYRKAYDLIKRCISKNESLAYEITDGVFSVWKTSRFDDKGILRILEKFNIIHSSKVKRGMKYEVEPIIGELLNYLYEKLDEHDESVKHYFIESHLHFDY